jgi:hypothetical protein
VQFEGGGPSPPVNWVSWSWWPEYEFVGFELVEDNITFSRVEADEAKFTLLLPVFVNPEADVVAITRARYKALERKLIVRAVSDNELAVLTVDGYGEMRWNEEKRFHQRVFRDVDNPGEVTVTSSEGDEDTVVVEVR